MVTFHMMLQGQQDTSIIAQRLFNSMHSSYYMNF